MKKQVYSDPTKLKLIFDFFDKNKKGNISFDDITNLKEYVHISKEEWETIVKMGVGETKNTLNFQEMAKCLIT